MIRPARPEPARRVVLVFIDGLGLGRADGPENPLADPRLDILANYLPAGWSRPGNGPRPEPLPDVLRARPLPFGGAARATDASLGVDGLPQSATGQTTLFTGENAALALGGRHYNGFPTRTLQTVLLRASIFRRVHEGGRRALFANAFTPRFFEAGDTAWTRRMGASTWAARTGGSPYRTFDDLRAGEAVLFDITHDTEFARSHHLPPRTPEEAGAALARLARRHEFTLFEFFLTDKAGHAQDDAWARRELVKLERFLAATLAGTDLDETLVVVTSDHGNVEDLSVKMHTLNPVPTLVFGAGAEHVAHRLDRLERFTPVFLEVLGLPPAARATPVPAGDESRGIG